jgi:hypothetical protein
LNENHSDSVGPASSKRRTTVFKLVAIVFSELSFLASSQTFSTNALASAAFASSTSSATPSLFKS